MRVVLATTNSGKLKELKELLPPNSAIEFVVAPEGLEIEETGKTFLENAELKARTVSELTGMVSLADDSGIEVDALDGRPGIYSARYCQGSDADRRAKLLKELKGIAESKRKARFVCAMAICVPTGQTIFSTVNKWEGIIALQERGGNGFGYDPIFLPGGHTLTAAEISQEEKNRISHRGQAFRQVLAFLQEQR